MKTAGAFCLIPRADGQFGAIFFGVSCLHNLHAMLTKKDKEKIIALVNDQASRAHDGAVADYTGTDVTNMTELRNLARENRGVLKDYPQHPD